MHKLLLLWAGLFLGSVLPAQIAAPDFICTRSEAGGEILTWQNVDNACGDYLGTEIYRAEAAMGPYTLLATITDRDLTEYRDENPAGTQLFYFLRYSYDCPGQEALNSDTLDSFIPVSPTVNFVSVVDGQLQIHWQPSPSPEVNRYVILEITDSAIMPIDTVGETTTYTVSGVPPDEFTRRSYRVIALDACGNDSPQRDVVTAFDVIGAGGAGCTSEIDLAPLEPVLTSFLPVYPDSGEIISLYTSVNGGPFGLYQSWREADFADTSSNYVYSIANDGDSLCFFFEIEYPGIEVNQRTVTYCQSVDITQPVRDFSLFGVGIGIDGRLRFAYEYPHPIPLNYTDTLEQTGSGGTQTFADEVNGILARTEVISRSPLPFSTEDSFRFFLGDECGRTAASNSVRPVILSAEARGANQTVLQWSALENGLEGRLSYRVYRIQADSSLQLLASDLQMETYTDMDTSGGGTRCYRVEAVFQPQDSAVEYTFFSNISCVTEAVEVFVPNVFRPSSEQDINRVFRPAFSSLTGITGGYRMQIFDRWGGLVFESSDPAQAWTGEVNGRLAPTGNYVYLITYAGPDGNLNRLSGVVVLLQ